MSFFEIANAKSIVDCRVVTGGTTECKQYGSKLIHAKEIDYDRDRKKLINKILHLNDVGRDELAAIHKNVLIRNAIQHRNGVIDSFTLKELGSPQIKILDMNGKLKVYKKNDKIQLSIPEIYSFKSSILSIGQIWRVNDD